MAEGGPEDVRDIQSMREELERIQKEIEHARKQKNAKERLRVEIERATRELAELTGDNSKGPGDNEVVAFTAVVTQEDLRNLGSGQTVVFDKVITNVGHCYDRNTGMFASPIKAVYVFEMSLMVPPDTNQYLEFAKDGQSVLLNFGHSTGTSLYLSSTRSVTLELEKNSKVWVRTILGSTPPHGAGVVHGYGFSTFSGWMLGSVK